MVSIPSLPPVSSHSLCLRLFYLFLPLLFQAAYPRKKEALFDQAARILSSNAGARLCDILCAAYQDAMGRFGNTFSMLFITLIGYWYGPKIGLTCAFAYGIMQFLQGGGTYILSPMQACLDYFFAFAALGVSGFFYKKKNGLVIGYIVAILARGLFHTIGGYIYWMDYMPESFPSSLAAIYPICYNYAYILLEGVVTVIILMLPPVKKAMSYAKRVATEQ